MIPKIIHYCWFGGNPIPDDVSKCIESWRKYCPDYKIIRWDENNYDIKKNQYMYNAYNEKKWAFVSDYARIDVIYEYGGIYLDTDVELVKSLDSLLNAGLYAGWESRDPIQDLYDLEYENSVNFGLGYGACRHHPVLKSLLEIYDELSFYNADGSLNLIACPKYQTKVLKSYGLDTSQRTLQKINDIVIYPEDYFSPKSQITGKIDLTENTYSIHHFSMSWVDNSARKFGFLEQKLIVRYGYPLGHNLARILSAPSKISRRLKRRK